MVHAPTQGILGARCIGDGVPRARNLARLGASRKEVADSLFSLGEYLTPKLTVLVITYNRGSLFEEFFESIEGQLYDSSAELVVVDNGSDPLNARHIRSTLGRTKVKSKLFRFHENIMHPSRWEKGFALSSGEFILLPGDDDVVEPTYLLDVCELVQSNPGAQIVSGGITHIDESGMQLGTTFSPTEDVGPATLLARLFHGPVFAMPATGVRRNVLNFSDAPRSRTTLDWWMWFQALQKGPAAVSSQPWVRYRVHSQQESQLTRRRLADLEAFHLLLRVTHSPEFRKTVADWNDESVLQFVGEFLGQPLPIYGNSEFGPLVQRAVAEVLAEAGHSVEASRVFATSLANQQIAVSGAYLRTLTGNSAMRAQPSLILSQLAVVISAKASCVHTESWAELLKSDPLPPRPSVYGLQIDLACDCKRDLPEISFSFPAIGRAKVKRYKVNPNPSLHEIDGFLDAVCEYVQEARRPPQSAVEWQCLALVRSLGRSRTLRKSKELMKRFMGK